MQEDRQVTVADVASNLDISLGSVHSVNDNNLYNQKMFARWGTKQLTDEHKWVYVVM